MLKLLRKYSRSWVIAVAIGAIVVVFIFWGIGGLQSPRFQEVASVNGEPIFLSSYVQLYNRMVKEVQDRAKGQLTEEQFKAMGLKDVALNQLIDEVLKLQAARRLGIEVSTPELQEHIRSLPYFQEDGRFSERRYQAILARARVKPGDFESGERQNLLDQKVKRAVTAFAKVSEGELQELYRLIKEEVEVNYLVVSPEPFVARQNPTDAAIDAYYQEHRDEFRTPDRVRVRFLLFQPQDFAGDLKPATKEVDEYINEHEAEFSRPKVIRVREIFLALPPKATPSQKQEMENKAKNLLQQARTGHDFVKLAATHSQDAAGRKQGGDVGDIKRGGQPPAWEKVAFALAPGTAGLAQTSKGFHIIKMEEVKETEKLPEAEARAKASQKLSEEKSRELVKEAAQRARGELTPQNFVEVAKKYKAVIKETPLFSAGDQIAGLDLTRAFKQTALGLKVNEFSKVVDAPGGFAVMQCQEQQPAQTPPLEGIKDRVRAAVSRQLARTQAEKEAAALLDKLKKGEPFNKVAADARLSLQSSGWFSRSQGFLKQPLAQPLTTEAFLLSQKKPYSPNPILWKDQYYLLAFKGRSAPSPEDFKQAEEKLREEALEQKKRLLFDAWLAQEHRHAAIKTYEVPSS